MDGDGVWQEISKWLFATISGLTILFVALVRSWDKARFERMDERIDHVNEKASLALDRTSDHEVTIAEMRTYAKANKDVSDKIDAKLDRLIERSGA